MEKEKKVKKPYEFFMIGLWVCTWLCFSVPAQFSTIMKCVWIFIAYTFTQSICATFINTNSTAYMVRAFRMEVPGLMLDVAKDNTGAQIFYEKVGFIRLEEGENEITYGMKI